MKHIGCREYEEIISAHVDGALSFAEGQSADSHLEKCPRCARRFLWERRAVKILQKKFSVTPAIPGLKERIIDRIDDSRSIGFLQRFYPTPVLAVVFALLLMVAVPYFFWQGGSQEQLFANTIAHYRQVAHGSMGVPEDAGRVQRPAQILDLSPWGYRLLAGQSKNVEGHEGRAFIYRGAPNEYLLAQEFERAELSPPSGARAIRLAEQEFVVYSREGVNLIAWKEKERDLVCIIASSLSAEKLLGLAEKITGRS